MKHKMWSRLLSMMLAVMMIASIVPNSAFAEAASEIVASSQAAVEVVEETEEVAQPEETTGEEPAEQPAGETASDEEPVAEPTAEPVTESEQPAAEPTQAPAETVAPSEEPSAEPTAAPEGTETPEGTAVPSETPAASATPAPSESPVPSETPVPTETPAPSEEPAIDGQALLDELMAIEDDEAFMKAVSELTEEQTATLEALGEDALAEYTLRVENARQAASEALANEVIDRIQSAQSDEELYAYLKGLTEADWELLALTIGEDECAKIKAQIEKYETPVSITVSGAPIKGVRNFTSAAPLVSSTLLPVQSRMFSLMNMEPYADESLDDLFMKKSVDEEGDTLTLEAYAKGEVKIQTGEEAVPTDIILVLDQSGSMNDPFGEDITSVTYQSTGFWGFLELMPYFFSDNVYYLPNGKDNPDPAYPVFVKFQGIVAHCAYINDNGDTVVLDNVAGVWPNSDVYIRKVTSEKGSKISALQGAARKFVELIAEKARVDEVDHRVAVVGFANGDKFNGTSYRYSNTELFVGASQHTYGSINSQMYREAFQNMNTESGVNNVNASIDNLSADGGTLTNLGLEIANNVFENNNPGNDEKRNRVVVVFTDGQPGWSGFDSTTANSAIAQAERAKNQYGASVYTIGVFDGADPVNGRNNTNNFMHYLSSNYPNATSMSKPGDGNRPTSNEDTSYYLAAGNEEKLNEIFEMISDEIESGGSKVSLNDEAVLTDVITPYFQVKGESEANIRVYTAECNGVDENGEFTFSEKKPATNLTPHYDSKTNTVTVSGFDYNKNYVAQVEEDGKPIGKYRGSKLIVEIDIERKDNFIGGNDVPTNVPDLSGIYVDADASEPAKEFAEQPTVDVPLQYEVEENDKTIYLTNSENLLNLLNADAYHTSLGSGKYGNDYVKITYTFTADGKNSTYTIDKSKATGVWAGDLADGNGMVKPGECKAYQVSVKVEPTSTKVNGVNSINKPLNPELHVVAPTIVWKDSFAEYNETIGDSYYEENNLVSKDNIQWSNHVSDKPCTNAPAVSGNVPVLNYEYTVKDANGVAIGAQLTAEAFVKVTVKAGADKEDVTAKTNFGWNADESCVGCTDPNEDPNADYQFRIHLKTGNLTITKTVTDWNNAKGDQATFFFEITDVNGKIYEQALTVSKTNKTATATMTLPAGTYTVEELNGTSGYRFGESTLMYADSTTKVGGQTVSNVKVGGAVPTVTFTNTTNGDNNPGDNGALNNWFKHEEGGWIWKLGGWNENAAG